MKLVFLFVVTLNSIIVSDAESGICDDTITSKLLSLSDAPERVLKTLSKSTYTYAFVPDGSEIQTWVDQGGCATLSFQSQCSCGDKCGSGGRAVSQENFYNTTNKPCGCSESVPIPSNVNYFLEEEDGRAQLKEIDEDGLIYKVVVLSIRPVFCHYRCAISPEGTGVPFATAGIPLNTNTSSSKIQSAIQRCKDTLQAAGVDTSTFVDLPNTCCQDS